MTLYSSYIRVSSTGGEGGGGVGGKLHDLVFLIHQGLIYREGV